MREFLIDLLRKGHMRELLPLLLAVLAVSVLGCSASQQPQGGQIGSQGEEKFVGGGNVPDALSFVKWFGHASFMFTDEASSNRIYYVDPFEFKGNSYEKADIIFITHAHYDHCDLSAVKKILKPSTVIVVPGGCREKLNLSAEFVDAVPNSSYEIKGFKFRTVPAYNVKPERLQYHPKANNWVGYIFYINNQAVYHAGDTDFIDEMSNLGKINVAMLPIGGTYTMDVDEAIQAANAIKADITVPMHYRRLLNGKASAAEEKFKVGVRNSRVVVLEEVA